MKQTALEWLYEEFTKTNYLTEDEFYMIFNQAKEMEKEQIENAFNYGQLDLGMEADEYYNKTFNKSIKDKG
jgi:hypothetical protein